MGRLIVILFVAAILYLTLRPREGIAFLEKMPRAIPVLFALLYLFSPIDLIPDAGPVGFLDDVLVLLVSLWLSRQQTRRRQADHAPSGKEQPEDPQTHGERETVWDPHAILGVTREATSAEITRAYREQMKRYHPDRVADLGEELQRVAHQKTLDIQRAYEELK
jgi:uncharacterized membrane protein YkvA (DUF1232 family)